MSLPINRRASAPVESSPTLLKAYFAEQKRTRRLSVPAEFLRTEMVLEGGTDLKHAKELMPAMQIVPEEDDSDTGSEAGDQWQENLPPSMQEAWKKLRQEVRGAFAFMIDGFGFERRQLQLASFVRHVRWVRRAHLVPLMKKAADVYSPKHGGGAGAAVGGWEPDDTRWDGLHNAAKTKLGVPRNCKRTSFHVKMADDTLIACDLYLPASYLQDGTRVPCVLHQGRYGRAVELRWPFSLLVNNGEPFSLGFGQTYVSMLEKGMAVLAMDVRGCGASGGSQVFVWHEQEALDALEVVDFIIQQPWSDGQVGVWGISYDAGTAIRLAALQHPAIKVAAPLHLFSDLYRELLPGAITNTGFLGAWCGLCQQLDKGNHFFDMGFVSGLLLKRIAPAGSLEEFQANRQAHQQNVDVIDAVFKIVGINTQVLTSRGEIHSGLEFSLWETNTWEKLIETKIPLLLVHGWLDVNVNGALRAFACHRQPGWKLIVGPWNHGGAQHICLDRPSRSSRFNHMDTAISFLQEGFEDWTKTEMPTLSEEEGGPTESEAFVMGSEGTPLEEPVIHFYVGGYWPKWRNSTRWPLPELRKWPLSLELANGVGAMQAAWGPHDVPMISSRTMRRGSMLGAGGLLALPAPPEQSPWYGASRFQVMADMTTPALYEWVGGEPSVEGGQFLGFLSDKLSGPLELVGNVVVSLELLRLPGRDTVTDVDLFAYLIEMKEQAQWSGFEDAQQERPGPIYITEGCMRSSFRKQVVPPKEVLLCDVPVTPDVLRCLDPAEINDFPVGADPWHSFLEEDKEPLPEGRTAFVQFALYPTAWRFTPGSKVGLVLTTGDPLHFRTNPEVASGSKTMKMPFLVMKNSKLWLPAANGDCLLPV